MPPKTMFDKIWDTHVVHQEPGQDAILYVDLHLVHEVTSPQAFEGLRLTERKVRRPDLTVGTVDHNVPTTDRSLPIEDEISARQLEAMTRNAREFGITFYDIHSQGQGIVHIIGPQLGYTRPGMTVVCGDSHTSTHGAFGASPWPLAPPRWSMCWPLSVSCRPSSKLWKYVSTETCHRAYRRRT